MKSQPFTMLALQIAFVFPGALLLGSNICPMAQNRRNVALLGGEFLFGEEQ